VQVISINMVHEITLKRLKLLLLSCSVKHASLGISDVTKSSQKIRKIVEQILSKMPKINTRTWHLENLLITFEYT